MTSTGEGGYRALQRNDTQGAWKGYGSTLPVSPVCPLLSTIGTTLIIHTGSSGLRGLSSRGNTFRHPQPSSVSHSNRSH
ncbi:hypothetical protein ANTQUA_LOCUS10331 [Anthophora quadrimaculata]